LGIFCAAGSFSNETAWPVFSPIKLFETAPILIKSKIRRIFCGEKKFGQFQMGFAKFRKENMILHESGIWL